MRQAARVIGVSEGHCKSFGEWTQRFNTQSYSQIWDSLHLEEFKALLYGNIELPENTLTVYRQALSKGLSDALKEEINLSQAKAIRHWRVFHFSWLLADGNQLQGDSINNLEYNINRFSAIVYIKTL